MTARFDARPAPPTPAPTPAPAVAGPQPSYVETLAALEARRQSGDDLLVRRMVYLRLPMNPPLRG